MPTPRLSFVLGLLGIVASALGQTTDSGFGEVQSPSMAGVAKAMHANIRRNMAEAADVMPAGDYAFRPTQGVRTFGDIVNHVAFANYMFCSQARGDAMPAAVAQVKQATDKPALVAALNGSLAYCDETYDSMTDSRFGEIVSVPGQKPGQAPRGSLLVFNTAHNNEHYGNLVVYLRLKGIVPPSTSRVRAR